MKRINNSSILFILSLLLVLALSGCSSSKTAPQNDPPPLLSQDELIRPYTKMGRIVVTREVIGTDYRVSSDIKAWGLSAIRLEAEKMGADAVILPEVTGHSTMYGVIPSTEYLATGFAIKFK
jgi:ABC-type uncharacterized transport system auxiliary subunit